MDVVGAALFGIHVDSKGDVNNEFARRAAAIFNGRQGWRIGLLSEHEYVELRIIIAWHMQCSSAPFCPC